MPPLTEKQFELGGVVFGLSRPVEVETWGPGAPELITSDSTIPGASGVRFGRDRKGATNWNFSLFTNADTEEGAYDSLDELAAAWDQDELDSEEVVTLRYCLAGRTRRVYGRPRRWSPVPTNLSMSGMIPIEADFVLAYPRVFDDTESSFSTQLLAPLELDAGVIPPFIVPFVSSAGDSLRQTQVRIGGTAKTPLRVKFVAGSSPMVNPKAVIGGWMASVNGEVNPGNPVTVDARPWVRAALYELGGGAPVDPALTQISKGFLAPGDHEVIFTAGDPSGSGSLVISWHDAYHSLR